MSRTTDKQSTPTLRTGTDAPIPRIGAVWFGILACLVTASASLSASGPQDVLPVRLSEGAVSLNGDWKFRYAPGLTAGAEESFVQPGFDVSAWKTLPVPSHWELHGFAEPKYASDTDPGLGLYRRTFRVSKGWQGKRVFLRFDGVLFGFTAFVNGKPVGEWASSFNPVTFDITDALLPGSAENVLAVRVTTRSKGWDFDTMDCWGLSGIFRDVTLFALAPVHFSDFTARTALQPDGVAQLELQVAANAPANVAGKLLGPDGTLVKEFRLALGADGRGSTQLAIRQPRLWTAETPSLYRLELDLATSGKVLQHYSDRIGLRQVSIQDGILQLNGRPIKLRGIDHHDIWPEEGRVANEARLRRDLQLIRSANINFIRTSHYPPHPRMLELCDELGIYVDDEVPFIHGRKNLNHPDYQDVLLTRARATVMRDKNRPSVILWSVGNENPINELGLNAGKLVKQLDPSRPITYPTIGSYFKNHYQEFPDFVDLYSPHYPGTKTIQEYAEKLTRPLVVTEYAHQRGLARGGDGVQDIWEAMYHAPRVAGGAIWMFQDQGLLRSTADPRSVPNRDLMVWLDENKYFDTNGYYGVDGIVYSDRSPQLDYWQVRKVYSPVQVQEQTLPARPGAQTVLLHVENRFDFRSLNGIKLSWSLTKNRSTLQTGVIALDAKPHETKSVPLTLTLPPNPTTDVFVVEIKVVDEEGQQFYERSIPLDTSAQGSRWAALQAALSVAEPGLQVSETVISVRHPSYQLTLDRSSGQCSILGSDGTTIASALGPHTARVLTINELGKQREGENTYWRGELLTEVSQLKTTAENTTGGVVLTVGGVYPRPGVPGEAVAGEYRLLLKRSGEIEVSYRYQPLQSTGKFTETGFALAVPPAISEFRWLGQGPYAGYPGKDRLNEYGIFHLNREDQYFPGNRRGVELAFLASPSGTGLLMAGTNLTVSVDYRDQSTVFSEVASGYEKNAGKTSKAVITGKFALLPLTKAWPQQLTDWFGQPGEQIRIQKRFFHSYDQ